MKIKGAIFDMDGTLIDSMGYWKTAPGDYIRSLGKEPKEDLGDRFLTLGLTNIYPQMCEEYGIDIPIEEVSRGIYAIMEKNYDKVDIKPYVKDMLDDFKNMGIKMCIASATNSDLAKRVLMRLGIAEYFSGVLCCKDVGRGKRYPDIYNYALSYLGTEKEETPVFEDAVFAIRTLKANGFVSVAIEDKYTTMDERAEIKEKANYYIDSYANWEKILK
ncbi:MAG: HAD family phosphatase [Clostridia bacterium]|nr:HAD family phosphatase [Clostridia bacterium]